MQDVALVGKQDELTDVHRVDSYGFCQPIKLRVKCDGARDGGRTTNAINHLHCACVIYARFGLKNLINGWNKTPTPSNFFRWRILLHTKALRTFAGRPWRST